MTKDKALKMALEALEDVQDMMTTSDWFNDRVQAVRQALSERHECETCAAKRKRLTEAGLLKSPMREVEMTGDEINDLVAMVSNEPSDAELRSFAISVLSKALIDTVGRLDPFSGSVYKDKEEIEGFDDYWGLDDE